MKDLESTMGFGETRQRRIGDTRPLSRRFFARSPIIVAQQLLGRVLIVDDGENRTIGVVIETEAYLAVGDLACHAARGRTPKTEVMFGLPGLAYVYAIHARHCFNVVTEKVGCPSAVLIRAIEPIEGIESMRRRRGRMMPRDLGTGPARLCESLGIDRELNGADLTLGRRAWFARPNLIPKSARTIRSTIRMGVTAAQDLPLRFLIQGHPLVSGPKYLRS